MTVGPYAFEGPYTDTNQLRDGAGVYAIHCHRDGNYYLVDVGESATVKTRVDAHDRKDCWKRECSTGTLYVSVYYTPGLQQARRMQVEQAIRQQFDPPCGKR